MRKLLIKLFVLDYVLGSSRITRASVIIFPLFIITGSALVARGTLAIWAFVPLFVSLYFGFIHFEIFKVKRNELSGSQLKQWDEFYNK